MSYECEIYQNGSSHYGVRVRNEQGSWLASFDSCGGTYSHMVPVFGWERGAIAGAAAAFMCKEFNNLMHTMKMSNSTNKDVQHEDHVQGV